MKISVMSVVDHYPSEPRSVSEFYKEMIEQTVHAEYLGFHAAFFAEHHFHQYGVLPGPAVFLGAVAQRTSKILLGPAVSVLPFHDPRTVAEDYAVVDILSNGRLILGVGSGYLKHEFGGYGLDLADKADRFNESLAIIRRLLARETVSYEGRFFRLNQVKLNVEPVQRNVPVYIAGLRKEVAIHVGRQGAGLLSIPYGSLSHVNEMREFVHQYNQGRDHSGAGPMPNGLEPLICTFHTYVARSDDEAETIAKGPLELYCKTRLYAKPFTYSSILESRLALFGSVETVAQRFRELASMGVKYVNTLHNFGGMPHDAVKRSMSLLAEEVLPRVKERVAA